MSQSYDCARRRAGIVAFACVLLSVGCEEESTPAEVSDRLADLELSTVPESPTNSYADSAEAAALGRKLFFDRRLSSDGTVACVDCHKPEAGFSDDRQLSEGVGKAPGSRHAMPLGAVALQPFLLWDGRADSVWRQPLYALENEREMNFTRTDVALFIARNHGAEYEAIFGALPPLDAIPAHVKPGDDGWEALPEDSRRAVQRVFVNVGKSLEAYERLLVCENTRFDQWIRGEIELTNDEIEGGRRFVQQGCIRCHSGPALSDGQFHNLGLIRSSDELIDTGRKEGFALLLADELNGVSEYSDDAEAGAEKLALAASENDQEGAFRTASLRGVTQRSRFGHLGVHTELEEFIDDTYRRGGRGGGGRGRGRDNDNDNDIVGTLDPILEDVNVNGGDAEAIIEFLRTTECAEPRSELLAP